MKKAMSIFGVFIISICCLSGCNNAEYRPRADEIYYKYNDNYRIIKLASDDPTIIEKFPILNLAPLSDPSIFENQFINIDSKFDDNSLFFYTGVNIEGAYKIYNLFNYKKSDLTDTFYSCQEIPLYTLNKRKSIEAKTYVLNSEGKHNGIAYGELATVKAYTINYVDRAVKDGKIIEEGSFKIYINEPTYFDEFYLPD